MDELISTFYNIGFHVHIKCTSEHKSWCSELVGYLPFNFGKFYVTCTVVDLELCFARFPFTSKECLTMTQAWKLCDTTSLWKINRYYSSVEIYVLYEGPSFSKVGGSYGPFENIDPSLDMEQLNGSGDPYFYYNCAVTVWTSTLSKMLYQLRSAVHVKHSTKLSLCIFRKLIFGSDLGTRSIHLILWQKFYWYKTNLASLLPTCQNLSMGINSVFIGVGWLIVWLVGCRLTM